MAEEEENENLVLEDDLIEALERLDLAALGDDDSVNFLEEVNGELPELQFSEEDIPFEEDLLNVFNQFEQEGDENTDPLAESNIEENTSEHHITPEQLLEQLDNLTLDNMPDEIRYCQPCDDPDSIPPQSVIYDNHALSVAAAMLAEEFQNEATNENASFWNEQLALLENSSLSPTPLADQQNQDSLPNADELFRSPILEDTSGTADQQDNKPPEFHTSQRIDALRAAEPYLKAFGAKLTTSTETPPKPRTSQRQCLGHRERILGSDISPDGTLLATASQDSTVRVWSIATNQQVAVLKGASTDHEMLRVAWDRTNRRLAGGGADGKVLIWELDADDSWVLSTTIDHYEKKALAKEEDTKLAAISEDGNEEAEGVEEDGEQEDDDPPQVYSLQFIESWNVFSTDPADSVISGDGFLLTSSDDYVHLWEMEKSTTSDQLRTEKLLSLHFGHMNAPGYGVTIQTGNGSFQKQAHHALSSGMAFGGLRNPDNLVFVFDASYCVQNGLLGVALSDGSLRLVNSRGVCLTALSLPGCQSHLTSFTWDSTGTKILTTVATGHIIVWGVEKSDRLAPFCRAIFQGGHIPGRPVFGASFVSNDELVMSWGIDGRICLWDGKCDEEVDAPLAVLHDYEDEYPVYSVAMTESRNRRAVAMCGGGTIGGIIGIPVYLVDLEDDGLEEEEKSSKRPKTN